MNKTILKHFTGKNNEKGGKMVGTEDATTVDIINLLQEMKGFLKEAATDLLQPRPEAVAALLKKAKQ